MGASSKSVYLVIFAFLNQVLNRCDESHPTQKIYRDSFFKEVETVAEAEAVLAKSEVVVFGFGDQPAHVEGLGKAAAELRGSVLFAHTSAEEVLAMFTFKKFKLSLHSCCFASSSSPSLPFVCSGDEKIGPQEWHCAVPAKDPAEQL